MVHWAMVMTKISSVHVIKKKTKQNKITGAVTEKKSPELKKNFL